MTTTEIFTELARIMAWRKAYANGDSHALGGQKAYDQKTAREAELERELRKRGLRI